MQDQTLTVLSASTVSRVTLADRPEMRRPTSFFEHGETSEKSLRDVALKLEQLTSKDIRDGDFCALTIMCV